jgi:nitroimidazol reductase NimA-like FMN-containing flavoprotein (pyridoxamine 5'-phosphate oxidase superfamily)
MKTFAAEGIGMKEHQVRNFLVRSKSTLILGTTDAYGTPMIHPVWYYFDSAKTKLYFYTGPSLRKAANIRRRSQVYFDVDSDKWPYKGVKGKGRARLVTSKRESLLCVAKILEKYVKKGNPLIKTALERVRNGGYVVFEITPSYFTSWDYEILVSQEESLRDAVLS